jgi:hypothetical protein
MDSDLRPQMLVGASAAILAALVDLAVADKVSWYWVLLAFVVPFAILTIYQGVLGGGLRPFKRWGIRPGELTSYYAREGADYWEFDRTAQEGHGFYGPYIPLPRGKYRVTYRLKIDSRDNQDQPVCDLDVTSNDGQKWFAYRTLSIRDFTQSDRWQSFHIPFDLSHDENRVEFRFRIKNVLVAQRRLSFQSVALRRRIL